MLHSDFLWALCANTISRAQRTAQKVVVCLAREQRHGHSDNRVEICRGILDLVHVNLVAFFQRHLSAAMFFKTKDFGAAAFLGFLEGDFGGRKDSSIGWLPFNPSNSDELMISCSLFASQHSTEAPLGYQALCEAQICHFFWCHWNPCFGGLALAVLCLRRLSYRLVLAPEMRPLTAVNARNFPGVDRRSLDSFAKCPKRFTQRQTLA